jgi:crotonobetainyl-CoA:carnitine CoA-transferase CaiB-like acyl-CoA transferase
VLIEILSGVIRTFRKLDLLSMLEAELIPVGSINEMHEVFADQHIEARGLVIEQNLSTDGPPTKMIGNPIRFSRTPISYRHPPPRLGEHTAEIIRAELEMSQDELDRLVEQGVISKGNA